MFLLLVIMSYDFVMKQYILANLYFPGQHTRSAVYEKLKITELRSIYIITDNARNMVLTLPATEWISVPCHAYTMQLAINDAKKIDT